MLIVTRTLTPKEFGMWGLIGGLINYVIITEHIVSYWATRETARGIESGKTAIFSSGLISLTAILGYIMIAYFVGLKTDADKNILLFAAILVPVNFLNMTLSAVNLGWKPHAISYSSLSFGLTEVVSSLILVYFLHMGIIGLILTVFIAYVSSIIILLVYTLSKIKSKFKKEFLVKWLKHFWIPLYPGVISTVSAMDVTVFSIFTGSVIGLAYWSASKAIATIVGQSQLISRAIYPKLLHGGSGEYVQENLTHLFYFAIPLVALTITFARPALFALNPLYEQAVPVVTIMVIQVFLTVLSNTFQSFILGMEKVDMTEKSTFKDYVKSKLFVLPTIILIQFSSYLISLTLILLFLANSSQLNLLIYWSIVSLVTQLPFTIYFYYVIRRNFNIQLNFSSLLKYLLVSIGTFGIAYLLMGHFLTYEKNILKFLPSLSLFVIFGIGSYLIITCLVDSKTRNLLKAVIGEIKGSKS